MWRIIFILLLNPNRLQGLLDEDHISIELYNGSKFFKILRRDSNFPDVERLFGVQGNEVKSLNIWNTQIVEINKRYMKKLMNLEMLEIVGNKNLKEIETDAFGENRKLNYLNLEKNSIEKISPGAMNGLFKSSSMLGTLHLSLNKLKSLPIFKEEYPGLVTLYIDGNPIETIFPEQFASMKSLGLLSLKETAITGIYRNSFMKNSELHHLILTGNKQLRYIDNDAFIGTKLRKLDVSGTSISKLPTNGLNYLVELQIGRNNHLFEIPDDIVRISTLRNVKVSQGQQYLCCAFEMKRAKLQTAFQDSKLEEISRLCPTVSLVKPTPMLWSNPSKDLPPPTTTSVLEETATEDPFAGFDFPRKRRQAIEYGFLPSHTKRPRDITEKPVADITDDFFPDNIIMGTGLPEFSNGSIICSNRTGAIYFDEYVPVICSPKPDALRPCDNIMGNEFLTALSWMVGAIGLVANAFVLSILSLSRRTYSVTKFLLQNLSFADLCLALYLFLLVCASLYTQGTYYNYVQRWQYGGGCAIAGFLAVFSSQLSMLVLVMITLERYFAIVYPLRFYLRLSFTKAKIGIILSWVYSFIIALLPTLGVNSYTEVAICLPFRTSSKSDLAYIGVLLVLNVSLFLFVLTSYIRMYWVVRTPGLDCGRKRADSEVAKRMALLVFTDFSCWAPIAFVSFMCAFGGYDNIDMDVKKAKYLLVIFFPINCLCNPFIYAATTSTFKRDVYDVILQCGFCQDHIAKMNETMYTKCGNRNHRASDDSASCNLSLLLTSGLQKNNGALKTFFNIHGNRSRPSSDSLLYQTPAVKRLSQFQSNQSPPRREFRKKGNFSLKPNSHIPLILFDKSNFKSGNRSINSEKEPLCRLRSNSDGCIPQDSPPLDLEQIRFSHYDLTPDSILKARETVGL